MPDDRNAVDRRHFLKAAGGGAAALPLLPLLRQEPAAAARISHHVPAEKKLDPQWVRALTAKGERKVYRGDALDTLAMPVGGIAAGQLYLTGAGRLAEWNLFQEHRFSGYGAANYQRRTPQSDLPHQILITAEWADGRAETRSLDRTGFPALEFAGEYPLAFVTYAADDFPLRITLQAFSPFIPLHAADSALPAAILCYAVENTSGQALGFTLRLRVESPAGRSSAADGMELVRTVETGDDDASAALWVRFGAREPGSARGAAPIVIADFEGRDYAGWTVEGAAFGPGPATGTLPDQNPVSGFLGQGLVNTYRGGDGPHGRLLSPEFTLERPYLNFLIGGGKHAGKTCVNLLVDGQGVASAEGRNSELLLWHSFDVQAHLGRKARVEIVDAESGGWGHVNVDQIQMESRPRRGRAEPWARRLDNGGVALGILPGPELENAPDTEAWSHEYSEEEALGPQAPWGGVLWHGGSLRPGGRGEATVILAWHFPNKEHGVFYNTRFAGVDDVMRYVARNCALLREHTERWHATWYDSTLPHWLLDRLHAPVANLATGLTEWRGNGRFWAWEGVGCCEGTCTHVWNYAHALGRLFPELERSVRRHQDFGVAFHDTGLVGFRGNDWYAADGQCGTILKAYREHLCSQDDAFLREHWPRIKQALEFLIGHDGDQADGLIEDSQHNTYDINFEGPNSFVGALYLAALRAGQEMAQRMGDFAFAGRCRELSEQGSRRSMERLFNGEYFIQEVDLQQHGKWQYGPGCLADQMFGQGWAHQLGLGYLYPPQAVRAALQSVWKYNWAPDIGPQNAAHPPERWFVTPGEAGLFTCTWPRSEYLKEGVRYREEVWTGIEYQVAGHMVWEGMLTEALAIVRAIHERYDGRKHNPWNEVECGDHYARALASWGVFTALCGFEYDGPAGRIAFAPRLNPENFRAAFTAAEGWGTYEQQMAPQRLTATLKLRWGRLALQQLGLPLPPDARSARVRVRLAGKEVPANLSITDGQAVVRLDPPFALEAPADPETASVLEIQIES